MKCGALWHRLTQLTERPAAPDTAYAYYNAADAAGGGTGDSNLRLGLVYMLSCYYLPGIGRFLSPHAIVPGPGDSQAYNWYAYTLNNSLKYTDPTGHCYSSP